MAQKAAEKLASPQGAVDMCATLQEKATERYEKIIESWNK